MVKQLGCPRTITNASFQKQSDQIYGPIFDVSQFIFDHTNRHLSGVIFCKRHKRYYRVSRKSHLDKCKGKYICKHCLNEYNLEKLEELYKSSIEKANKIHKGKYTYESFIYVKSTKPSLITCKKCRKKFSISMNAHLNGKGCKVCSLEQLSQRFRYSFEKNVEEAEKNHGLGTYDYSQLRECKNQNDKGIAICKEHGEWETKWHLLIHGGFGCPKCNVSNKTEKLLLKLFEESFNYDVIYDKTTPWIGNRKRYDFIIEELKCIIELDGRQHFKQVSNWDSPEYQLENDIFKNQKAMENGYTMIRVYQPDIFEKDPETILKLILSIHRYREPQLICIGDIYKNRF